MKNKYRGRVQVVLENNNEVNIVDDVFKIDELVDAYRVTPSIDLEEKINFHVIENIFIDVDVDELNDI